MTNERVQTDGVASGGYYRGSRKAAISAASLSGITVLAGVSVLALRTAHTYIGDGPVPAWGVVLSGVITLVLPIGLSSYRATRFSRRTLLPVGLVSMAAGVAVALIPPGNMFVLGYLVIFAAATTAILIAERVSVGMDRRTHA